MVGRQSPSTTVSNRSSARKAVPRGDDFRGMPTHQYRIHALYRNCIAGIRRAGGKAHRPPTRTEVRHGRRPQGDVIREMPTHEQCVTAVIYRHIRSRAYGGRGDQVHRPPTRTGVRHGRRPTGGMKSAECLHTSPHRYTNTRIPENLQGTKLCKAPMGEGRVRRP